ncbi:MAG TPA: hypothetical protein VK348_03905 [Planctomycetota bacterium]|nr:hypothetical protein [Planctomycetota bacterium]
MLRTKPLFPLLALLAGGCAGGPAPVTPQDDGRGLIAYDQAPPAGAKTFARPSWRLGDRFVLMQGAVSKSNFTVTRADAQGYELTIDNGLHMRRDLDLGILGEWPKEGDVPQHALLPVDVRYHWPLWVGKRWRCHYIDRSATASLSVESGYEVEGEDTITSPAGTFSCLRIRRTSHLQVPGQTFMDRTQFTWYAPDPGVEVRHTIGDTLVELIEWQRGA